MHNMGQAPYMERTKAQSIHVSTTGLTRKVCLGAALNKFLSYDLIYQIKEVIVSFDNNYKGAYDNLVPPKAILNCCKMALPRTAAKMLTKILNNTVYKLKILHILSVKTYQISTLRRILGIGQGSYTSPSILITVLDLILWSIVTTSMCFK